MFLDKKKVHFAPTKKNKPKNIAKKEILKTLGLGDYEVYFFSNEYEMYSTLLIATVLAYREITTPVIMYNGMEDAVLLSILEKLENDKMTKTIKYNLTPDGNVDLGDLKKTHTDGVCLVLCSPVNQYIGACNTMAPIVAFCHEQKAPVMANLAYQPRPSGAAPDIITLDLDSAVNVCVVNRKLIDGYKLYLYSPVFQTEVEMRSMMPENIYEAATANLKKADKKLLDRCDAFKKKLLSELAKILESKVHSYSNIISKKIHPGDGDIIVFGGDKVSPFILSFMVMHELTAVDVVKKLRDANIIICETAPQVFDHIGLADNWLNRPITIGLFLLKKPAETKLLATLSKIYKKS